MTCRFFAITRIASFKELGVADNMMKNVGETIINWQNARLVIGGLAWGVLVIRKEGRAYCSALFFCTRWQRSLMDLYKT